MAERRLAKGSKAKSPIDRDVLVRAALEQIDEVGLRKFSMRQLAAGLGVTTAAPYWHVRDTDELFGLVIEEVLSGVEAPTAEEGEPLARATELLRRLRRAMLEHPNTVELLFIDGNFAPRMVSIGADLFFLILEAGVPLEKAAEVMASLMTYLIGSITMLGWVGSGMDEQRWADSVESAAKSASEQGIVHGDDDLIASEFRRLGDDPIFLAGLDALLRRGLDP